MWLDNRGEGDYTGGKERQEAHMTTAGIITMVISISAVWGLFIACAVRCMRTEHRGDNKR